MMPRGTPLATFTVRQVRAEDAKRVHGFHLTHVGHFLWPRTIDDFTRYVADECLFEAVTDAGETAAICYVKSDAGDEYEFGGVLVDPQFRGRGIVDALGRIAIASEFVTGAPASQAELIAHVHEDNAAPRGLLTRLGFAPTQRKETLPGQMAPQNMRRNAAGDVVGDVFLFDFASCVGMANWIESFNGTTAGKAGSAHVRVEVPFWGTKGEALEALRAIGAGYRST